MALSDAYKANFQTMLRAADAGRLALMECTDIATGEVRAVICAVSQQGNVTTMVPFGHLCPGNPYEHYSPPVPSPMKVVPRRVTKT